MKPTFYSDPINSTYRWEIYLTQGHPANKVPLLDGYSKGTGFERTNKVELLLAKLTNPLLPYLERSDRIVVYEQVKGFKKEYHPELIVLYHHDFELHNWARQNFVIEEFLLKHYQFRREGKLPPPENRRNNRRVGKDEYKAELNHADYTFATQEELVAFCKRHIDKYTYEGMKGWYHSHAMFQPELFEAKPKVVTVQQSTAGQERATAQSTISAIHSNMTKR